MILGDESEMEYPHYDHCSIVHTAATIKSTKYVAAEKKSKRGTDNIGLVRI